MGGRNRAAAHLTDDEIAAFSRSHFKRRFQAPAAVAVAKLALVPVLPAAEKLQQQIEHLDGLAGIARHVSSALSFSSIITRSSS